jgi:hypothetical protein
MSTVNNCITFKPLDEALKFGKDLAFSASPWLNDYIKFSRKWSPRSFDDYHEACGLWVLSTIAGRRLYIDLGKPRYTGLYIILTGRTSVYAKSSVAQIAVQMIHDSGFDFFIMPDECTPQKFIEILSNPDKDEKKSESSSNLPELSLLFQGKRSWFYEEFGQKLEGLSRGGGNMSDYKSILRRFDDFAPTYKYATIGRGFDIIEKPYLALLANITPSDISSLGKKGAGLWRDGFFARFAFISPYDFENNRKRFPMGKRKFPKSLITKLKSWHENLGIPELNEQKKVIFPETLCTFEKNLIDAFYNYQDFLIDTILENEEQNSDGNNTRLAEKALRISILLASLENNNKIEIKHWARAQEITERWRYSLFHLQNSLYTPVEDRLVELENRVISVLHRNGKQSVAEIENNIRNLSKQEAMEIAEKLFAAKVLGKEDTGRTIKYFLI